ncbi:MAG: hypothetical protein ACFFCY_01525 [Promethearchaeota archaeon]
MSFNSEGYFCEGEVEKDWQFKMEFGRIILSDKDLSFIKKSNINLTEIGTNFNKFNEGFKIPLLKINKVYNLKKDKIYVVIIETTDGYTFSATFAEYRNSGKKKSMELTELINRNILKGF